MVGQGEGQEGGYLKGQHEGLLWYRNCVQSLDYGGAYVNLYR